MPTMNNYLKLIYVNLGFLAQIVVMVYFKSILNIKKNWPIYRCNPAYWVFSSDISSDFTYCIANTQKNMMGYLLQPLNYMTKSLTSIGSGFDKALNNVRKEFSSIRGFVSKIIKNVFSVFINLIIEFEKIINGIKDMVGKMIGVVMAMMYILEGSILTMNSSWNGPTGQLVRALGSCFHPETIISLSNGKKYKMEEVPLGSEMPDGGKIFAVMKIDNEKKEPVYKISGEGQDILVTGEHFVFDKYSKKWVQVKNYKYAEIQENNIPEYFSCLITSNRNIKIDSELFWDWEDDELTKLKT